PGESVGCKRRVRREERRCLTREGLMELKQRTVSRIRIREQDRVREVFAERVGVRDRDHLVMNTVHDERWLTDRAQICEALARDPCPVAKSRNLCNGALGS